MAKCFDNEDNLFELINLCVNEYNIIEMDNRIIGFFCYLFSINFSIYKHPNFRTVKKVIIRRIQLEGIWFKFHLNKAIYTDNSRIEHLPREIGMIGMMSFQIENQMIRFIYSSHSFEMVFRNNENMDNLEWNIKFKAGLGNDENLYDFGNRRILKGEMIFEHQNVILKRSDRKFETEECDLADLNVYIFIGKIKIQTRARCFTGWNRKGLLNHIGRLVRMKNAIFNLYWD